jgi:hypothetical protein
MEELIRETARKVEPRREFSDSLWAEMQSARKVKIPMGWQMHFTRPAWGLTFAALALAIGVAAYGPQNVLAAVKYLIGYIPGIGFVEQDESTLYLAKPVSVTQKGVTLTVEQAVANANGIVVSYHMDGLPEPKSGETYVCVYSDNRLRLPDGKDRLPTGGGITGSQARIEFAPLPAGVKKVTLVSHGEADCPAPIDWSVDIPLGKTAPKPALPVMEVTAVSTAPVKAAATEQVPVTGQKSWQIDARVEKTVKLDYGWLVTGRITWQDTDIKDMIISPDSITITDASGKNIPIETTDASYTNGEFGFILKQKDIQSPVKITISGLQVNAILEKGPGFSFDAGKDPRPGQEWAIGKTLEVFGMPVEIVKAAAVTFDDGKSGYAITMKKPEAIYNIGLRNESPINGKGWFGEARPLPENRYEFKIGFPDGRPDGKVTLAISDMFWKLNWNHDISWNMPE